MDQSGYSTILINDKTSPCIVCGSINSKPLFEQFDLWYNRKNVRAKFVICQDCGLIFQSPQRLAVDYQTLYPEVYHPHMLQKEGILVNKGLHRRCKVVTEEQEPGNLLDIGCGTGEFIRLIRDHYGWQTCGVEVDEIASKLGREQYGLQIYTGVVGQMNFPDNFFDAVTLWDVLEHVPNPRADLTEISRILKPGGILVLRLPNSKSWDAKLFGKNWAGYDPPRHFFVFNRFVLGKLLHQTGFSVASIRTDIGSYPNFVKSVQFTLTSKGVTQKIKTAIIRFLSSLPVRLIMYPLTWLKDRNYRGTSIVLKARNNH